MGSPILGPRDPPPDPWAALGGLHLAGGRIGTTHWITSSKACVGGSQCPPSRQTASDPVDRLAPSEQSAGCEKFCIYDRISDAVVSSVLRVL